MTAWTDDEVGGTVWSDDEVGASDGTLTGAQIDVDADKVRVIDATDNRPKLITVEELVANTSSFTQSGSGATEDVDTVQGIIRRAFGLLPGMNGITFFDTFSRANTSAGNLGTTESGHTWDLRGAYAGSYPLPAAIGGNISDGKFVLDPATATVCYATYTFPEAVTRMGARISWADSGGSGGSTFAMVSSVDNKFIDTMIHFTVTRSTWKVQVRVAGGSFVDLLTGSFSPTLSEDGTIYTVELILAGRTATVNCNGKVDSIYDSRIPTSLGKYAFWEIFYNDATPEDKVRVHAVWAGCAPVEEYIGNARHNPSTGVTDYQGALGSVAGLINAAGTDGVEATISSNASTTATGGFRRSRFRLLNHTGTDGIVIENKGDESLPTLDFFTQVSGTGTRRLRMTTQGLCFINIQNSITAFAGGGQASATALTGQLCRVTTVASAGDSVKLPAAIGNGTMVIVANDGANSCNVYPTSSDQIDALGTNNPLAVAAGKRTTFYDVATDLWFAVPGA